MSCKCGRNEPDLRELVKKLANSVYEIAREGDMAAPGYSYYKDIRSDVNDIIRELEDQ